MTASTSRAEAAIVRKPEMMHFSKKITIGLLFTAVALPGQSEPAGRVFEVAAIKPAASITIEQLRAGTVHVGLKVDGARVDIGSTGLNTLVMMAYRIKPYQVIGPDWMAATKFDIAAKLPEGATRDQVPEMLQALLAERFKLSVHRETRDYPIFALVTGKKALKLQQMPEDTKQKLRTTPRPDGLAHIEFVNSLPAFASFLAPYVDRPVVDMTGLPGIYAADFDISRNEFKASSTPLAVTAAAERGAALPDARSPFFFAIEELGLKLEPRKTPTEMVVVDHLEKTPTEN